MTRSQAPLSLEYILLGFLYQSSSHGYDIYKKISDLKGISMVWHVKLSQLYALLDKLEADGLLTSQLVPGEAHLMRKKFQITPMGKQTFLTWITTPVKHGRDMRQEFLAKLYFAQKAGIEDFAKLIEEQKLVCTQWLSDLETSHSGASEEQQYERMIFQYRIHQTQAMIEWLDYCRAQGQVLFSQKPGVNQ